MNKVCCPLCGCGELEDSSIVGYECPNCGESFVIDDAGELVVIEFDEWQKYYFRFMEEQEREKKKKKKRK